MDTVIDIENNSNETENAAHSSNKIHVIYGTHTGNTMMLADEVEESVEELGYEVQVEDTEDFEMENLPSTEILLVLVSTDGEGDQPLMTEDLFNYLQEEEPDLSHLSFSVLALGDTTYDNFCQAGKDFDALLERLGGQRIAKRIDCDVDYEEGYEEWINNVLEALKERKGIA